MRQRFAEIKEALCEKCALYIPNDTGEYAIHADASVLVIGGVLKQQLPDGSWAPCTFYSTKLEGQIWYCPKGEALGFTGRRAWSVREKDTYARVSCLLRFTSWIPGRKGMRTGKTRKSPEMMP